MALFCDYHLSGFLDHQWTGALLAVLMLASQDTVLPPADARKNDNKTILYTPDGITDQKKEI